MKRLMPFAVFLLFFAAASPAQAADDYLSKLTLADDGTRIEADYSFSIGTSSSGWEVGSVCTTETSITDFGMTGTDAVVGYKGITNENSASLYQGGNFWMRWKDVGTFNGVSVDLRATVVSWDAAPTNASGDYTAFYFSKNTAGYFYAGIMQNIKIRFEILETGSDAPVSVKGHGTVYDIDGQQGCRFEDGVTKVYYRNDLTSPAWFSTTSSGFLYAAQRYAASDNDDEFAWATFLYEGSSFTITYTVSAIEGEADVAGYYLDPYVDDYSYYNRVGRASCVFGFRPEAIAPFETPSLEKTLDGGEDAVLISGGEALYHLYMTTASELPKWYYQSLSVTDFFPAGVKPVSWTVFNADTGEDLTNMFTVSESAESGRTKLVFTARSTNDASFYGVSYDFQIQSEVLSDFDWAQAGSQAVNEAWLTIDGADKSTTTTRVFSPVRAKIAVSYDRMSTMLSSSGTIYDRMESAVLNMDDAGQSWSSVTEILTVDAGSSLTVSASMDAYYDVSQADFSYSDGTSGSFLADVSGQSAFSYTTPALSGTGNSVTLSGVSYGSLSGLVFADLDADGVKDAGEAMPAGIDIVLYKRSGAVWSEVSRISNSTQTDDAAYAFTNLAPGYYAVGLAGDGLDYYTNAYSGSLGQYAVSENPVDGAVFGIFGTDSSGIKIGSAADNAVHADFLLERSTAEMPASGGGDAARLLPVLSGLLIVSGASLFLSRAH